MPKIKEGFKGERMLSLSEAILESYQDEPIIYNLYLRKIGYFPQVKFHYVNKPEGCNYWMLIYCTDGTGWYTLNNQTYQVEKNQFFFLPPHKAYAFGADDKNPWTIYWVHFRGKSANKYVPEELTIKNLTHNATSRFEDRFNLFEELYSSFSMAYVKEYMIYSSICLSMFLATFTFLPQYRHIKSHFVFENEFSAKVIRYMQENVHCNLTLASLASYFNYSPSYFSNLFSKETGVSPINYFLRLKIQKACYYMEMTKMSTGDIARKLGFKELSYFSRLFSKTMGISPTEYRIKEQQSI